MQAAQVAAPAAAVYDPPAQGVQVLAPAAEYVPAKQVMQAAELDAPVPAPIALVKYPTKLKLVKKQRNSL